MGRNTERGGGGYLQKLLLKRRALLPRRYFDKKAARRQRGSHNGVTGGQAADAGGEKGNWEREEMEGKFEKSFLQYMTENREL